MNRDRSAKGNSAWLAGLLAAFLFIGFDTLPAAASASPPETTSHPPSATVQIGDIGDRARISLRIGDTLAVLLPANVTTGYGWQVIANSDAVLAPGARSNLPAAESRIGAAGRQKLSFIAKAAGRDRLVLGYARPWEKKAAPTRTLTLEIEVAQAGANAGAAVTPDGTLLARYEGKLPCADCSGIRQMLALYASTPGAAGYYVETMTYLNAPHGDVINITAGKWSEHRGTGSNPNATIYSLNVESSPRTENYELTKRGQAKSQVPRLVPLDSTLHPIQSPYDMTLHPVP